MILQENDTVRDYRIIRKIGEGGMGSVYLAEDTMLDRKAAIKALNPLLTQDNLFTERFRQEARVQAGLIHPNIVSLHNFFVENGSYFMVMEYAEGTTLKEKIAAHGAVPEKRAAVIFSRMLDALGYAHSKGVIHRDIKPGNIIIDSSDNVKILDFGIAKILGDKGMTKTGAKMGTVYYMSPEQIRASKDIDQRTDIYSLGITLYEMLTGRLPFNTNTESDFEVMEEIIRGTITAPERIVPSLSNTIVNVIYRMTEKEKEKRPATCFLCGEQLRDIPLPVSIAEKADVRPSKTAGEFVPEQEYKTDNNKGAEKKVRKKTNKLVFIALLVIFTIGVGVITLLVIFAVASYLASI
ncbi:MAG: serine/threonine-protein kinase [Ignavibacteria bacterium]